MCGWVSFVTSSPTFFPSTIPSVSPITSIPSARPSLSGWVSTISATATATEDVDSETIEYYKNTLADYYGVSDEDVVVSTVYTASGTMSLEIPSDATEAELVDAITNSLADSLGVHPQNVDVSVDMETGAVEYSVTAESFNEASQIQFDLENDLVKTAITDSLETGVPGVTVNALEVDDDVTATLEFTIDADVATNDLTQAAWQSEELMSDFGEVEVQSKFYFDFDNEWNVETYM